MKVKSKFIVVEHQAKRAGLHYDFRFRMPRSNKWASFAVRKGIPTEPGKKVLAVRTHDHSEKEALFTGEIKSGYGAGKLKKWDDGPCTIIKYSPAHIVITLKGKKLKGTYHLVSTGVVDRKYKEQTYMMFKSKILQETILNELGMDSRVPPEDTQEVEIDDEEADKQQKEKLTWSQRKKTIKT